MAWARIDDAFDDHEKVLALLDMEHGVAAVGLWTLCLTYAHRNTRKKGKIPGFIPTTLPRRFVGADGKQLAALLVEVRLWDEVDDGWMIHDFAEYLPDREVRAARSAAGKRGAAARWGNRQTDGKLPSDDGKSHGKRIAPDGSADSGLTATRGSTGPESEEWQDDGKLPSGDGNLPSVSHLSDGKSMASDGSRAGARGRDISEEISPNPIPVSLSGPARTIADATDATPDETREILELIKSDNKPRSLAAYVKTLARNGDLPALLERVRTKETQPTGERQPFRGGSRAKLPTAEEIENGKVIL